MTACLDPFAALDLLGSFLWAATYVLIVRRGAVDRASGVPFLALATTFAWEILYAVHPTPTLPWFVVPAWLAIDAAIVYQYLRHGDGAMARRCATLAAAIVVAGVIERSVVLDWGDRDGIYTGFAVNVVISLAFLSMALRRRDVGGQSMYVAIGKLAGTAIMIPHALALHGSLRSLRAFMGVILLGDLAYAVLLHRRLRALGIRPWARV